MYFEIEVHYFVEIQSQETICFFAVVRGVKKNLLHTLAACTTDKCQRVLHDYKVNQMSVQVDFDKVSSDELFLISNSTLVNYSTNVFLVYTQYMDRYFPKV